MNKEQFDCCYMELLVDSKDFNRFQSMIIRPQWYDVGDNGSADSSSSDLVAFARSDMPIFHQFRLISDQLRNQRRSVLNHPDPNNTRTSGCISPPLHIEVVCRRNLTEAVECIEAFHPTLPHFLALVRILYWARERGPSLGSLLGY